MVILFISTLVCMNVFIHVYPLSDESTTMLDLCYAMYVGHLSFVFIMFIQLESFTLILKTAFYILYNRLKLNFIPVAAYM